MFNISHMEKKGSPFSIYMRNSRQGIFLERGLHILENVINKYTEKTDITSAYVI